MAKEEISYAEKMMCLGKTKHRSLLAAEYEFQNLFKSKKANEKIGLGIYLCHFCECYHIGHSRDLG